MNPAHQRLLKHGVLAGSIGYAVVVAFFAIANVAQGRSPLFTAAVLGNTLLGAPSTGVAAAPVAVYNGLHLTAFLLLGLVGAWLAGLVVRRPQLWYLLFLLGVVVFFHLFGVVASLAAPAGADVVPLWEILAASFLAVSAMAAWLWRAYPGIRARVGAVGDFEDQLEEPGAKRRS
ncbi:MAG TPA: hypothetical protein VIE68_02540 [Gemmatimonadota bacterium]